MADYVVIYGQNRDGAVLLEADSIEDAWEGVESQHEADRVRFGLSEYNGQDYEVLTMDEADEQDVFIYGRIYAGVSANSQDAIKNLEA